MRSEKQLEKLSHSQLVTEVINLERSYYGMEQAFKISAAAFEMANQIKGIAPVVENRTSILEPQKPIDPELCKDYHGEPIKLKVQIVFLTELAYKKRHQTRAKIYQQSAFLGVKVGSAENPRPEDYNYLSISDLYYEQGPTDSIINEYNFIPNIDLTVVVGHSKDNLNGFAIVSKNFIFVSEKSWEEDSHTIAHEIGHIAGLGHTFDMSPEEKELLGITKENEESNFMNYTNEKATITDQQKSYICNYWSEYFKSKETNEQH